MSIVLLAASLMILIGPIFINGSKAFIFRSTIEFRRLMLEEFARGSPERIEGEFNSCRQARQPVFAMLARFEADLDRMEYKEKSGYRKPFRELKDRLRLLLGPLPGEPEAVMLRQRFGQTRWDRALLCLREIQYQEEWDYSDSSSMGRKVYRPRIEEWRGTSIEPLFSYLSRNLDAMLNPKVTFYWRFLFDTSRDSHFFGGIWPEILGTFYLTIGTMIFAIPMGIIAAIYLAEFAREGGIVSLLRSCISTLAGVPSIVFGLFGLAFFINAVHLSRSKSVLIGSATLALLILPTIIRSSEEAIRAVPQTYKEAALSLGASPIRTVFTVIIPAALPGILTGIVISMGRAAGETAPIIFTAAVSVGNPLKIWETLSQPTPALPWNIYNLATEHEAVDQIRHVQYGMVLTLVLLVLLLNLTAILLRARVSKKLHG